MTTVTEHDTRAEMVAGLRHLANFLEQHTALPSPVNAVTYAHEQTHADVVAFANTYGARLHEWEDDGVAKWMATFEVATVNGCHHVEYVMAGSEPIQ